jgi:maltose alpha-D-glucosyltransferase/alpha-amylase
MMEVEEVAALELSGGWETVLEGAARQELEQTVLPDFLRGQRWFGGKARRIEAVRLADRGDLPAGAARAFLLLVEVRFADGASDLYFLPLAVTTGPAAGRPLGGERRWLLARLTGPGGAAVLHDALADDAVCTALLDAIGAGREFPTREGAVRAFATTAYPGLRGSGRLEVRRGPATSSNSLVFYEHRLLLKLFRRLEVGINPDLEIGRFLTERRPFDRAPKVAGALEYRRPGTGPMTLAILQEMVANQGDGWEHTLDELRGYFGRADTAGAVGDYLGAAATLGRRTAELHLALVGDATDPAFAPEPLTAADLEALREDVRAHGRQALTALRGHFDQLPADLRGEARRVLHEGPVALLHLKVGQAGASGMKIRVHGDYHLGQVLWAGGDFILLDFEGEPTRSVEERRAKQSPLKDVAGMLRSFHYAAYAGLFAAAGGRLEELVRLEPRAVAWQERVSAAFLEAYHRAAADAAFLPRDPGLFQALLDGFMLGKAFYELAYELNNRPDWVRIPLHGILALI